MPATDVQQLGYIFTDSSAYADPQNWHAAAKRIREESPVMKVSVPRFPEFWAVTTHAEVFEVERHPDIFTNAPLPTLTYAADVHKAMESPVQTLIQMDGDRHKAHRGIVSEHFKPGRIRKLRSRVDELATHYVDRMGEMGGRCDFVTDVALHFPLQVILSLLGLPEEDYPRMLKLTQELFGAEDPDIARKGVGDESMDVLLDFANYFAALTADRRAAPRDDIASVIANATIDGQPLDDFDTIGHYVIITTAGHDTTSNAIAGGMVALLENPDQLELLQREPDLVDGLVDEVVRYLSPVKHFCRTAQEPFTLGGAQIERGDLVLLSYASANRDETVFSDAMRFDVERTDGANHLAFGFGRHFCLGSHLARMEIRAIFAELLPRLEHIELAGEPRWIHSRFVQGPKSVPISYRMR